MTTGRNFPHFKGIGECTCSIAPLGRSGVENESDQVNKHNNLDKSYTVDRLHIMHPSGHFTKNFENLAPLATLHSVISDEIQQDSNK